MAQNVYDDPDFFAGYAALERSQHGLDGAPEWPALRAMLPTVDGARVVDLGCGYGWFSEWAAAHGAMSVIGYDISERMLETARRDHAAAGVEYRQADLDRLDLEPGSADLVFSSLTLHYLRDIDRMFATIAAALSGSTDGYVVASFEHPIYTAPAEPRFVDGPTGTPVWPLDGYQREGERITDWIVDGVRKHHRTVSTYLTALLRHGFVITAFDEWQPSDDDLVAHPEWSIEHDRPMFALLAARLG